MKEQSNVSRRHFIGSTLAATAAGTLLGTLSSRAEDKPASPPPTFTRKIKVGLIGCGGRGMWLTKLFQKHGDRVDACGVVFELDDGTLWTHVTQSLNNNAGFQDMSADVYGLAASAHIAYSGKVTVRGGKKHYVGNVSGSIYNEGATRNVADFYRNITEGHFENPTVKRAVDGHLSAILGREAAARKTRLTMADLLKENKKLEVDLKGLKA